MGMTLYHIVGSKSCCQMMLSVLMVFVQNT